MRTKPVMLGLAALAVFSAAPALLAGGAADTPDVMLRRLLRERAARNYLGIQADLSIEDAAKLVTESALRGSGDFDGDGIPDAVFVARKDRSCIVTAFLSATPPAGATAPVAETPKTAEPEAATTKAAAQESAAGKFAGFVRMDADELPSIEVSDLTGKGVPVIRAEAWRIDRGGASTKSLWLLSMRDGALAPAFRGVLESNERTGGAIARTVNVAMAVDLDGDGANELQVLSRTSDLAGPAGSEAEITESICQSSSIYSLKDSRFVFKSSDRVAQSASSRLAVAGALAAAGATDRAAQVANEVLIAADSPVEAVAQAKTLIERLNPAAPAVVAADAKTPADPATPAKAAETAAPAPAAAPGPVASAAPAGPAVS